MMAIGSLDVYNTNLNFIIIIYINYNININNEKHDINSNDNITLRFSFSAGNSLTLGKFGRIVIDISKGHCQCRGPGQAPGVSTHVFGLDDDQVLLLGFSVHVGEGSFYNC